MSTLEYLRQQQNEVAPPSQDIGSIENKRDIEKAVEIIRSGGVVAVEFPGTGGLIYDAGNASAVEMAMGIKAGMYRKENPSPKKDIQKTTSLVLSLDQVAPIVDMSVLRDEDKALFYKGELRTQVTYQNYPENPRASAQTNIDREADRLRSFGHGLNSDRFRNKISGLIFLKLVIQDDARVHGEELPSWTYSFSEDGKKMIHVLNFDSDPQVSPLIKKLQESGIHIIGVTSMNYSGNPEVVDVESEKKFAQENDLFFLENPSARNEGLVGSYTIVRPDTDTIERHGNIVQNIIEQSIFGRLFSSRGREAHYPPVTLPDAIVESVFSKVPASKKIEVLNTYARLQKAGKDDMTIEEELLRIFIHSKGEYYDHS